MEAMEASVEVVEASMEKPTYIKKQKAPDPV